MFDFAFLIHSRESSDLRLKYPFLPNSKFVLDYIARRAPIIKAGTISGIDSLRGIFIGIPMTAKMMLNDRQLAVRKIQSGFNLARQLGCKVVGLGGYTGSLSANGQLLQESMDCVVTTGHAFTIWVVCSNALKILERSRRSDVKLTIVGAGGSIGFGCFMYLRDAFHHITLVDSDISKIYDKAARFAIDLNRCDVSDKLESLVNTNIVIVATSSPEMIIDARALTEIRKGTIFIDDAQPMNVDRGLASDRNIVVLDGGIAHSDSIKYKLDLNMAQRGDFFGCMGEAMLVAKYGKHLAVKGSVKPEKIHEIGELARKEKIRPANFQVDGKVIDEFMIDSAIAEWI